LSGSAGLAVGSRSTEITSAVGGVGWLPGSIVGAAFIIFVPNIAEGISKGLSGAVFGVLLFVVIFVVPHGARQIAIFCQQTVAKFRKR